MPSYLFYDLETSGLNPCFDQVYQFAAIRTDENLNPIEEIELEAKPTKDIIPSPMAMITHQLPIQDLMSKESESEVIKKIHKHLNTPGTISLGYNTLTFDDEFLRFNFYRHLLTPYTHQFKDNCNRMDIFPMLIFYYLYRPDTLNWPMIDDKITFRLEHLSSHNQLAEGQAHHAMVDVRATLALAKILKKDQKVWQYLLGFFNKYTEQQRHQELEDINLAKQKLKLGLLIDPKIGAKALFQAPAICLGQHRHYKNQMLWLRLDQDFTKSTTEDILKQAWVINKKWGEPPFVLPLKSRFIRYAKTCEEIYTANLAFLKENPEIFKVIQEHHLEYKHPLQPNTDADARLYQSGFMSSQDEFLTQKFHNASPEKKADLKNNFGNPDLQEIANRYLGRFHYQALNQRDKLKFDDYLAQVFDQEQNPILDYRNKPKLLKIPALKEIDILKQNETFTPEQQRCLEALENYLKMLSVQ